MSTQVDHARTAAAARKTLEEWQTGVRIFHTGHDMAASYYHGLGRLFGGLSVVFSTIVGTAIFATLGESPNSAVRIVAGAVSVLAAVFAGVQAFLNLPQLVEQHRQAMVALGRVRRRMDVALATAACITPEALIRFSEEFDEARLAAAPLPQHLYNRARKHVDEAMRVGRLGLLAPVPSPALVASTQPPAPAKRPFRFRRPGT